MVGARSRQSYRRIGYCEQSKRSIGSRSSSVVICIGIRSGTCAVKPCFTDTRLIRTPQYYEQFALSPGKEVPTFSLNSTRLIRTPQYYGQFALSLGKESLYFFSKFNPLNTDTSVLRTVCFVPGERKSLLFL